MFRHITLVMLIFILSGCMGQALRGESAQRWYALTAPPDSTPSIAIHDGPYHLGIRLTEGLISSLIHHAIAQEIEVDPRAETSILGLSPYLTLTKTQAQVGDCNGCLNLSQSLTLGLQAQNADSWLASMAGLAQLQAHLTLTCHVAIDKSQPQPQLILDEVVLKYVKWEGAFDGEYGQKQAVTPDPRLKDFLSNQINQALLRPDPIKLPLPMALTMPGQKQPLSAMGLQVIKGDGDLPGELFIGLSTTEKMRGVVTAQLARTQVLRDGDWALVLGESVLHRQLSTYLAHQHSSEPQTFVDITHLNLERDQIAMTMRYWNVGKRPYWKSMALLAGAEINDGHILVHKKSSSVGQGKGWHRRALREQGLEYATGETMAAIEVLGPYATHWADYTGSPSPPTLTTITVSDDLLTVSGALKMSPTLADETKP